ncbi:hypothetical protein D3C81_2293890 [compost metagenome]
MLEHCSGTEAAQINSEFKAFGQMAVYGKYRHLAQFFIVDTDSFQVRNIREILGIIFWT